MKVQPVHFITVCLLTYNFILTCFPFFIHFVANPCNKQKRCTHYKNSYRKKLSPTGESNLCQALIIPPVTQGLKSKVLSEPASTTWSAATALSGGQDTLTSSPWRDSGLAGTETMLIGKGKDEERHKFQRFSPPPRDLCQSSSRRTLAKGRGVTGDKYPRGL